MVQSFTPISESQLCHSLTTIKNYYILNQRINYQENNLDFVL